ncbi:head GIN domain-containing protein [Rugamonas sp.]|uniref:head GIN domain-containing protein n=1 Tax=Rugamonas sp. TaxID=1926287 RepID=UPI002600296D|nr:head GIN domain-containing protein [Rugamonas sp.]
MTRTPTATRPLPPAFRRGALLRGAILGLALLACTAPVGTAQAASWSGFESVEGNGHITKQSRELGHFTALATSVSGNVEVRLGDSESITIETDDNIQPLIEATVENGTLRIRPQKKNQQFNTHTMKIVVQARTVERIAVGGAGSVDAARLHGEKLVFDIGGSGSIDAREVQGEEVAISLGGSGNFKVSGHVERLQVSIGGSGKVQAGQLAARDVRISIGGSGQATVSAQQTLNVSVAGSGDIGYYGNPQVSKTVMGSGAVKHLGGAPM